MCFQWWIWSFVQQEARFGLAACVCVCTFIMDSKLNCCKKVSFACGRLLCISFFHYRSDWAHICITVGLAPVALNWRLLKPLSIAFFWLEWLLHLSIMLEGFDRFSNLCVCSQEMEISMCCGLWSCLLMLVETGRQPRCIVWTLTLLPFSALDFFLYFQSSPESFYKL